MGCMHINNDQPVLVLGQNVNSVELGKRKSKRWNLCVGLVKLCQSILVSKPFSILGRLPPVITHLLI